MNTRDEDCEVLIVGGGPVGLALACELGRRGVSCIVVDPKPGFHEHPRATTISPRTMEYFSSWGIVEEVFDWAVSAEYPMDVIFTATIAGEELGRLSYPTIKQMKERTTDDLATFPQLEWSRYGKVCIGQNRLEPVLGRYALRHKTVRRLPLHELVDFTQSATIVSATVKSVNGVTKTINARYLVGCDGARSVTRQLMGAQLEGVGDLGRSVNTFFRAPGLVEHLGKRPGFLMWALSPGVTGAIFAIDGDEQWVYSRHLMAADKYDEKEDPRIPIQAAFGKPLDIEVISSWSWFPRQLLATKYADSRVMLVGDSAHLMSPTGGYGLNTGIADAMNLAWKLAATLKGWGGPHLLQTYGDERRQVAHRNSEEATDNRLFMRQVFQAGSRLEDSVKERAGALDFIKTTMHKHGKHFDGMGIYLGDRYDNSPLTISDGSAAPPWDAEKYFPSTCPGGRLPLCFSSGGKTLHERCGMDFTLISTNSVELQQLIDEFARCQVPLTILAIGATEQAVLGVPHLLVRPDGIVAWRSSHAPADAGSVVDALRGNSERQLRDAQVTQSHLPLPAASPFSKDTHAESFSAST